jgi:hypothetical protein
MRYRLSWALVVPITLMAALTACSQSSKHPNAASSRSPARIHFTRAELTPDQISSAGELPGPQPGKQAKLLSSQPGTALFKVVYGACATLDETGYLEGTRLVVRLQLHEPFPPANVCPASATVLGLRATVPQNIQVTEVVTLVEPAQP